MNNKTQPDDASNLSFQMIFLLGAIAALTPFAIDMYLPAMPEIAKDLMASAGKVQQTLVAYTTGFAIGQIVHGPISDSYGRRPVLLIGIFFFALAAIVCSTASNIDSLIMIRAIQGFCGAAAAVIIQAIVRDKFDKDDFARIMSFITLVMTVAPLIAPMIGGYLSVYLGWRSIFILITFIAFIVMGLAYKAIPETLPSENRPVLRIGATLRNYAKILTHKQSVGYIFASAFSFGGLFSFITAGSFVYIEYFGISPENFSYFFGLNVIFLIVITFFNGKFVKQVGSENMLKLGLFIQLVASVLLMLGQYLDWGLWGVALPVALFIGTMSMVGSNSLACVLENYPEFLGTSTSLVGTLRFGVGSLVGALLSLVSMNSALPMTISIASCGMISTLFYLILVKRA